MDARKQKMVDALYKWVKQRPGLEFGNYGDAAAYRAELRSITKDLHHARAMLRYVELSESITADMVAESARSSYSGRLSISDDCGIDYCTGQYWPTEYRRAVCAVLAYAIWWHWREHCMPEPEYFTVTCLDEQYTRIPATSKRFDTRAEADAYSATVAQSRAPAIDAVYRGGFRAGAFLRDKARREFGASIAKRWFN